MIRVSGAEEETRTPTACSATAPSTLRVYQFHHLGTQGEGGSRVGTPKGIIGKRRRSCLSARRAEALMTFHIVGTI